MEKEIVEKLVNTGGRTEPRYVGLDLYNKMVRDMTRRRLHTLTDQEKRMNKYRKRVGQKPV